MDGWSGWSEEGGVGIVFPFFFFFYSYTHIFTRTESKRERERERERKKERRTDCSLSPSLWSFALSPPLFVDVCDAEVRNGNFDLVDEVYARRVLREQADQNS